MLCHSIYAITQMSAYSSFINVNYFWSIQHDSTFFERIFYYSCIVWFNGSKQILDCKIISMQKFIAVTSIIAEKWRRRRKVVISSNHFIFLCSVTYRNRPIEFQNKNNRRDTWAIAGNLLIAIVRYKTVFYEIRK